jgi:hypothetical protein
MIKRFLKTASPWDKSLEREDDLHGHSMLTHMAGRRSQALTRTFLVSFLGQVRSCLFPRLGRSFADDPLKVACLSLDRPCKTARRGNDVPVTNSTIVSI